MRTLVRLSELSSEAMAELDHRYRRTDDVRLRMRVQRVLLAAEQRRLAPEIARIVRTDDETVRKRKRRRETADLLQALVDKNPHDIVFVSWDNASSHQDDEIEAVVRGAASRLVLLYLPTYSSWLNRVEMLWRHFRRDVTHCELFETLAALHAAALDFLAPWARHERMPRGIPVGRRRANPLTQLVPSLEATPLQCQRAQHLPPRLNQLR